ncbi:MAG: phosphoenolpyruvate synthase [Candidatus Omnitrophica bacterium]|nr:phosphoenolpyruvate synthase [Candidatus Omnitrophota bacterium]
MRNAEQYIRWLQDLHNRDVAEVGGKNASLGEMLGALKEQGVRVPAGFATTASAYRQFLRENELETKISGKIESWKKSRISLAKAGKTIRRFIRNAHFSREFQTRLKEAYRSLCEKYGDDEVDVAVRSSATAEDLPEASFAGQQETFLNISGEDEVLEAAKRCYASLFTDRAIAYREEKGFDHLKIALSVGVQKMVRSDLGGAGVMFSLDTETGFRDVAVINAAWGLGETVVQGSVTPDEYVVFKPLLNQNDLAPIIEKTKGAKEKKMVYAKGGSHPTKSVDTSQKEKQSFVLTDEDILRLARWTVHIENHYAKPMDIEWAKDGESGDLFIVQARPETVQSQKEASVFKRYRLKERGERIVQGLAIGQAVASGKAQIIKSADEIDRFRDHAILVTGMTDPDWVPAMKRASGVITDLGGRTSHAAIVSRELGIPALVGTGDATETIDDGNEITLSCAEGDQGFVYSGKLKYEEQEVDVGKVPETNTRIMMNIASPAAAFRWWKLPARGIGLARMEFIINNSIKAHPLALVRYDGLKDTAAKQAIARMTKGYKDKSEYFVEHLARGIGRIAASQYPDQVVVRMSDFKTNEYANLIGGAEFEPEEDNPMIGFRGASRYYSESYREGFALECRAIARVRNRIGLRNVTVMVPFCRTVSEGKKVLNVLREHGLERGKDGLQVYVMAEIPSNIILAEQFADLFDGFSIGSNDLTQLILGIDRDSAQLSELFDERNEAVTRVIGELIEVAHSKNRKVGICGQAPSDYPEFAEFLVRAGIDSISLNPDSVIKVIEHVSRTEQNRTSRGSE